MVMTVIIVSSTIVRLKVITIIPSLIIEVDDSVTREMSTRSGNERKMWVIFVQITPHRVVYAKKQVDSAHFRNRRDKMYIITKCT